MSKPYRILRVKLPEGSTEILELDALGPIDAGLEIHERAESHSRNPLSPENPILLGWGRLSGIPLFGTHRITVVFRSPVTRGLHASTMGGAAYAAYRTGVDAILVEGRSEQPAIISVVGSPEGEPSVEIEEIPRERLEEIYQGYKGWRGTRALHAWIAETRREKLAGLETRFLVVGPAAWKTLAGSIVSWVPRPGSLLPSPVADGASRGGGGSVLAQAHNVAAVIVGGPRKYDGGIPARQVIETVSKLLGEPYYAVVERTTTKYRFDPKLGTGGTFGVNYVHYRELLPALAYNTIYMSRSVRLSLHEKIMRYFWRPFQEEVFESKVKPWRTCGEPCSVACKKVWRNVKLDYEPAHGLGPMIGVITLEDSAELVELADDLGIDAIESGHIIAWLFDAIERGLLTPRDLGLEERPTLDPLAVSPETSKVNARAAKQILEGLVAWENPILATIARDGARTAAKMLDEQHANVVKKAGIGYRDLLVYAAFGEKGYMTPNYYWSPGMIAPLYILGRYWTNYSPTYADPEDYARDSLQRAKLELEIDNVGMCRFHRKWAGKILGGLYRELAGIEVDIDEHALKTYRRIAEYNRRSGAEPVPWESRKTMDIVATIAAELGVKEWEGAVGDRDRLLSWWRQFKEALDSLLGLK